MLLPKLVVFDMAGTTVEDRGEVPAAFTAALAEHGVEVTTQQVNAVRGASKRQAVFDLLPDDADRAARAEQVYATFKEQLAQRFAAGVRPISGAAETFAWLRERGVRVALNTGFDREIVELLLAALHWRAREFAGLACGDDVSPGRPSPQLIFHCMAAAGTNNVRDVAAVGDTVLDLQAGYNAGVRWNIGVLSGAHTRQQLEQVPHTRLLPSVADLPSVWSDSHQSAAVTRRAELPEESFEWGTLQWLTSDALSPGAEQTLGLCHIFPGRRNPVHYHPNCQELLYMLSGQGTHSLDGQRLEITAGDTIRIPANVKHNLANTGAETIVCLISFSSGRRETVFLE